MEKFKKILVILGAFILGTMIVLVVVDTEIECVENRSSCFACDTCSLDDGCVSKYGVHLDSTLLECSWYPLYCGFGSNNLCGDLTSIVLFGCDLTMCRTYEYGNEREEQKGEVVEAEYGVDYIVKDIKLVTDYGIWDGFMEDGEVSKNIFDWNIADIIKNMQIPTSYKIKYRWVVEYEVYTELHSATTYIDMVLNDDYSNPKTMEIRKGNETSESTYRSIKKGTHYAVYMIEWDIFQSLYLGNDELKVGNIRMEGYKYLEE